MLGSLWYTRIYTTYSEFNVLSQGADIFSYTLQLELTCVKSTRFLPIQVKIEEFWYS